MAVDPATRPTARRPDRPVTANRHQGGRPAATRPATEARWFHGRRTATSPRPPRGSRSEDRAHGRRPGCRQHRLRFYDDPNPIRHAPQSQSLSRSYGSILPTSLIYIVLSTRGCSPWRPAAVMSTTWRKNYFFKRIFKARRERTKRRKSAALFQPLNPSSGQTDFRVTDR